jgi:hypothetical protein
MGGNNVSCGFVDRLNSHEGFKTGHPPKPGWVAAISIGDILFKWKNAISYIGA